MNKHFDRLVELLSRLPGIGPRHATRIVLALLNKSPGELTDLASGISQLPQTVRLCKECFNVSDDDLCPLCKDASRPEHSILVVERISDLQAVERAGLWSGRYHVLGGSIDPVGRPSGEHLRIGELIGRARDLSKKHGSCEVVLATGTDSAGETTAQFIRQELAGIQGLSITQLGKGLATGAHLEYADEATLKHALEGRK